MPKEIEHKFLVNQKHLPSPLPTGKKLLQGYLCCDPAVRVRIVTAGKGSEAFLTIKGKGLRVRDEFEYKIPLPHARALMKLCGDKTISKIRRKIGRWEVDEFLGRHDGIWLAEYELAAREKLPALPPWAGKEVTNDPHYTNVKLALEKTNVKALKG